MNVVLTPLDATGSEPRWSPNGTAIVYSDHEYRYYSVWFVRADGSTPRIVPGLSGESPRWSPSGDKVLVRFGWSICQVDQTDLSWKVIYGKLIGDSETDQLVDEFSLSPDGQTLAILHAEYGREYCRLVVSDIRGTIIRDLKDLGDKFEQAGCLSWSPDGQWIAFEARTNDSRKLSLMAYNPKQNKLIEVVSGGFQPEWSPKDMRIAFLPQGDPVDSIEVIDFKSRVVDSLPIRSSDIRYYPRSLTWSPDATLIAFQRTKLYQINQTKNELAVLRLKDRKVIPLLEGRQLAATTASWSPDSSRLVMNLGPEFRLHVIDIRS